VRRDMSRALSLKRSTLGAPAHAVGRRAQVGRWAVWRMSAQHARGSDEVDLAAASWNTLCSGTIVPACGSLQSVDARCVQQFTPLATSPLILLLVCEGKVRPWPWSGRSAS
jgi:hypothetical protein